MMSASIPKIRNLEGKGVTIYQIGSQRTTRGTAFVVRGARISRPHLPCVLILRMNRLQFTLDRPFQCSAVLKVMVCKYLSGTEPVKECFIQEGSFYNILSLPHLPRYHIS